MRFSTIIVASASLLGLSYAAPGDHQFQRRQAVTNSSSIAVPSTSSILGTGSSSSSAVASTTSSGSSSSSISSTSVPISTPSLATFAIAVQASANSSLTKRQATVAGYVGLSAADALIIVDTYATAATFSVAGGALTVGGLSVFGAAADVAAPGYGALAVEAVATITTDITTTFGESAAGALVWTNAVFPDGDAIFFVLDGALYASFTGALPAGATVVTLVPVAPSTAAATGTSVSVTVSVSVTINISITIGVGGSLGMLLSPSLAYRCSSANPRFNSYRYQHCHRDHLRGLQ